MNTIPKLSFALFLGVAMPLLAQTPTPPLLIVQAANAPAAAPAARVATTTADVNPLQGAMKTLEEIRTANQETLKKQEAALEKLDEMQKAVEQLRIFSHRTGG